MVTITNKQAYFKELKFVLQTHDKILMSILMPMNK
jgi:hypothetical protein